MTKSSPEPNTLQSCTGYTWLGSCLYNKYIIYWVSMFRFDSCSHFSPCKPSTKWQGFQTMHVHRYPGFPTKCPKLRSKEIYDICIYLKVSKFWVYTYELWWIMDTKTETTFCTNKWSSFGMEGTFTGGSQTWKQYVLWKRRAQGKAA